MPSRINVHDKEVPSPTMKTRFLLALIEPSQGCYLPCGFTPKGQAFAMPLYNHKHIHSTL